ncbi:hypothetical protein RO3G_13767 [Rhizopus delemar RA 99-880]|uniref:Uncharacterized protein n=1 Tax=Rhizopus delemar (strain RA 99-880 / ATCC MYA-4621 / FGSC 9543 / NRRL 43880) TaxID=246409 RepID=I1CKS6_RHIO9|nr:hypothetical protein RO3G_13767 [Rhizopus delemar RA 99-880]|eukprot:EIE89056.1 hypothetical protein RO3G_13767 [Rhizopus delemar RA 99-880]
MAEGNDPSMSFTVNGHQYERDYYPFDVRSKKSTEKTLSAC